MNDATTDSLNGDRPSNEHTLAIASSIRCPCTGDRFLPSLNGPDNHMLAVYGSIRGDRLLSL